VIPHPAPHFLMQTEDGSGITPQLGALRLAAEAETTRIIVMAKLPESVIQAWQDREGPIVLTTLDQNHLPNSIYATCVLLDEDSVIVANNYFDKTLRNIAFKNRASVLFLTKEGKSFQLKGSLEYHVQGPIFEAMKRWNPPQHPGHGAAVVRIESAFSGAQKLL